MWCQRITADTLGNVLLRRFNALPDVSLQRLDELRMDVNKMQQSPDEVPSSTSGGSVELLSANARSRRRALFKGIGKSGAVLAAAVPIQTLAGGTKILVIDTGNKTKTHCSISGMHSAVHSAATNQEICGGYSCDWWRNKPKNQWPSGCADRKVKDVFGSGCKVTKPNTTVSPTCHEVLTSKSNGNYIYGNLVETHWVCAWLNSQKSGLNSPYSAAEVVGFYQAGRGSDEYQKFLQLHTGYLNRING